MKEDTITKSLRPSPFTSATRQVLWALLKLSVAKLVHAVKCSSLKGPDQVPFACRMSEYTDTPGLMNATYTKSVRPSPLRSAGCHA